MALQVRALARSHVHGIALRRLARSYVLPVDADACLTPFRAGASEDAKGGALQLHSGASAMPVRREDVRDPTMRSWLAAAPSAGAGSSSGSAHVAFTSATATASAAAAPAAIAPAVANSTAAAPASTSDATATATALVLAGSMSLAQVPAATATTAATASASASAAAAATSAATATTAAAATTAVVTAAIAPAAVAPATATAAPQPLPPLPADFRVTRIAAMHENNKLLSVPPSLLSTIFLTILNQSEESSLARVNGQPASGCALKVQRKLPGGCV